MSNPEPLVSEVPARNAAVEDAPAAPQTQDVLEVIYIRSIGHSGSTLLDMLISSHDEVEGVGSLKNLVKKRHRRCTCSAPSLAECPFWQTVETHLKQEARLSLGELNLESFDPEEFSAHNLALFRAVRATCKKRYILDSSKSFERAVKLCKVDGLKIRIINLERSPFGVVYSTIKKNRDYQARARNVARKMIQSRITLAPYPQLRVRYERLAREPEHTLRQIMEYLDLSFQEHQLEWAGRVRHNFGGNSMRHSNDSTIRVDTAWRRNLSAWQKTMIILNMLLIVVTRPVRVVRAILSTRRSNCRHITYSDAQS